MISIRSKRSPNGTGPGPLVRLVEPAPHGRHRGQVDEMGGPALPQLGGQAFAFLRLGIRQVVVADTDQLGRLLRERERQ
ncbi:hypothetical protein HH310_37425 [Actinoplanes sp. TBRC 11911]|uniref:hypothetical protein n=1 Tax=Actinoplanes sp. TBRC 11911 TaxID=2729386 RepID=UPI00145CBC67|nr:hypothetical protein [Actinoplanes sp. TBRC 11911]NMO56841.1 hypothetical protein [Actinoplanes sp. TBRC 11911]